MFIPSICKEAAAQLTARRLTGRAEELAYKGADRMSRRQWREFWALRGMPWAAQVVEQKPGSQFLNVLPPNAMVLPDLQAFMNEVAGIQEVLPWPLYSYRAFPAATNVTQLLFFGESESAATNGRADTNMVQPSVLPGNQMHVPVSINITPIPAQADAYTAATVDAVAFRQWYPLLHGNPCWLEMKISQKEVMVGAPLTMFPESGGFGSTVFGAATVEQNAAIPGNGTPDNLACFHLDPPLGILPVRPFSVSLNWLANAAGAFQQITTAGRIGVTLWGWLIRAVS